jgi:uncharacterized membrane protein YfcA
MPLLASSMNPYLMLAGAGFIGGTMNALAGGGSFVTLPALIAAGVPSVQANASSTVALLPASAVSAWAYRGSLVPVGPVGIRPMTLVTLAGGTCGAILLLSTPTRIFDFLLPWLLLLATCALIFGKRVREWLQKRYVIQPRALLIIQFFLGVYGGYFGGAVGIMMMAVWALIDSHELKHFNAPRTLLATAANFMAVLVFIVAHAIRWPQTLTMLAGAIVGGYFGAVVGRSAPAAWVRIGTLILTSLITIAFFIKTYG